MSEKRTPRIEPEANIFGETYVANSSAELSIAISLKRIADALEAMKPSLQEKQQRT